MLNKYSGSDFQELIKDGVTVVDFFATWCGPCKMLMPEFESLAKNTDGVNFVTVDIDQYRELTVSSGVNSVPTLVIFKDGKELARRTGFAQEQQLLKWIESEV